MPIKMYDLMWKDLCASIWDNKISKSYTTNLREAGRIEAYKDVHNKLQHLEEKHTYISQPEALKLFNTSRKTLAHLRDDWGMPYVTRGTGQQKQFFYKEEEVRTHLEELRGKK